MDELNANYTLINWTELAEKIDEFKFNYNFWGDILKMDKKVTGKDIILKISENKILLNLVYKYMRLEEKEKQELLNILGDKIIIQLNNFWEKNNEEEIIDIKHIINFLNFEDNNFNKNFSYDSYLLLMYPLIYKNNKLLDNFDKNIFLKQELTKLDLVSLEDPSSIDENKEKLKEKIDYLESKIEMIEGKIEKSISILEKRMIEFTEIVLKITK